MVAGCGMKCVKFTIFFFNAVFLLVGTAFIIVGAYAMASIRDYAQFIPMLNLGPTIIIVVGSMIFVPAFFGCCGAIRESRCMLITYAVFMGILMLLELIVAIVGFVYGMKVRNTVQTALNEMLDKADEPINRAIWAMMSQIFQCCGIHSPEDWRGRPVNSTSVPEFCVIPGGNATNVLDLPLEEQRMEIYTKGCLENIEGKIKAFLFIISGTAIGIALVELIGIILASCLAKAVKSRD